MEYKIKLIYRIGVELLYLLTPRSVRPSDLNEGLLNDLIRADPRKDEAAKIIKN